jgi:hypothetical protein
MAAKGGPPVSLTVLRRAAVAGALFAGLFAVPASPVAATTIGPTIIAVHRNGAVDIRGNSYGTIATMSVPAGNWLIRATATVLGVNGAVDTQCELVAGADSYTDRTDPTITPPGNLGALVLLLGHHFVKAGSVSLNCTNNNWSGAMLIRDVHVAAIQVGTLTSGDVAYGTGTPIAVFQQVPGQRLYFDANQHVLQDMSLGAGTWLVQASATGLAYANGDRIDCTLASTSSTADFYVDDFEQYAGGTVGLEGVIHLAAPGTISMTCKDSQGTWQVQGSAITAMKVGTLTYGHIGGTMTTSGSGTPTVVGAYSDDVGAVAVSQGAQSIGNLTLGAGSWFVTSHTSLFAGYPAQVTCQLQLGGANDQARVNLDTSGYAIGWLGMSLTRKLTASSKATIACGQSGQPNDMLYLHDKIFAIKAGSLTDTALQ